MKALKIIHTADLHFDNKPDLLKEIVTCTDFLAETAKRTRPDAVVITGDLTDQRLLMDSAGALAAQAFIRRLAEVCPVLIVKGTELHDFDNLKALAGLPNVTTVEDVRQVFFKRDRGFYEPDDEFPEAVVSCLPSLSKSFLISLGTDTNTAEEEVVRLVGDLLRGWGSINRELRAQGVVTIVAGHGTIGGAVTSTGQVMIGRDLTYGTDDLKAAGADYIGFGHIHKAQQVGAAWYCGSIGRINAGEQEPKGFIVVELEPGMKPKPQFIRTPAREFIIIDLGLDPENWKENVRASLSGRDVSGNVVVKVKTSLSETNSTNIVRKEVEEVVGKEIIFDKTVVPIQRTRAEGISKLTTAKEKYIKWAESSGQRADEEIMKLVDMLDTPKEEMLAAVRKRFDEATADAGVTATADEPVPTPEPAKGTRKRRAKDPEKQAALAID